MLIVFEVIFETNYIDLICLQITMNHSTRIETIMKIYLASKSPRRRELLTQMGVVFDLLLVYTPEIIAPDETAERYSMRVTKEKLDAAKAKILQDQATVLPVLCADTEVVLDGQILGGGQSRYVCKWVTSLLKQACSPCYTRAVAFFHRAVLNDMFLPSTNHFSFNTQPPSITRHAIHYKK